MQEIKANIMFQDCIFETYLNTINNKKVVDECYYVKHNLNSTLKSNAGGFQSISLGQHNLLKNNLTEINSIANLIINNSDAVAKEIGLPALHLANLWININKKGNYNRIHSHPGSILSGVYYVKADSNSGRIRFIRDRAVMDYNYAAYTIDDNKASTFFLSNYYINPDNGKLLIFPSHLLHDVEPSLSTEDRISISFNMVIPQ